MAVAAAGGTVSRSDTGGSLTPGSKHKLSANFARLFGTARPVGDPQYQSDPRACVPQAVAANIASVADSCSSFSDPAVAVAQRRPLESTPHHAAQSYQISGANCIEDMFSHIRSKHVATSTQAKHKRGLPGTLGSPFSPPAFANHPPAATTSLTLRPSRESRPSVLD